MVSLFLYMKVLNNPKMYQFCAKNTFDTLKLRSILEMKSRGYSGQKLYLWNAGRPVTEFAICLCGFSCSFLQK